MYLSQNLGSYIIQMGSDWPECKTFKKSIIKFRRTWEEFINRHEECLKYLEYHYLNRILSNWEENLSVEETQEPGYSDEKVSAWHYALAMVLLQIAGSLKSTIGKKGNTITQAKIIFKVSDKIANNIYHSTKNMKYTVPDVENSWNINYFLKQYAPIYRSNYKIIVRRLLDNDDKAIELLNNLPD